MTSDPGPRAVAVVGHSHLVALQRAADEHPPLAVNLTFLQLRDDRYRPEFERRSRRPDSPARLNRRLLRDITRVLGRNGVLVSCIGGNSYNILGLLNHPRPFDFVLPSQPRLEIAAEHELIPACLVREILRERLDAHNFTILRALRAAIGRPMYHLESPPPVPSEEHIRKFPGVFRDRMAACGVSPAALRYKLWRLQSELVQEACAAEGIVFVPVPDEARDDSGFLSETAWNPDPTHGNAWYGACVLRHIAAIAANSDALIGSMEAGT